MRERLPARSAGTLILALLAAIVLAQVGCAHRQAMPVPTTPQVKRVKVEVTGDQQLKPTKRVADALGTRPTPWWAVAMGAGMRRFWVPLDRNLTLEDQDRIERYYEDHGFFDARCTGMYIKYRGRQVGESKRWAVVTFTAEEGPRSLVRDSALLGVDRLDPIVLAHLSRRLRLVAGQPFTLPDHEADRAALQFLLNNVGYAYAAVSRRADAYPEEQTVDLHYDVQPGIRCHFGEVTLEGLDKVPRRRVEREVRIERGDLYSLGKLQKLQSDLFGMGVFSMVTVAPDLSDPSSNVVPIHVSIRESKPMSIKLGVGVGMERGRDDAHVSLGISHRNLFGRLLQLHSDTRLGWAVVPDLINHETHGPIVEQELYLVEPLPIRALTLWQRAGFELDVESGYKFLSPSASVGLDVRLHRTLSVGLAYNYEFFWLYWQDPDLVALADSDEIPEIDTDGKYNLSYLEQSLTWDARDDPVNTNRGIFARFSVAEAGGFLSGGFDYVKLSWEARTYIDPVPKKLVLALHLQAGWILPWGDTQSAPLSQKFKIGGSGTVRGWGRDMLGPRIYPETDDNDVSCTDNNSGDCDPIPIGGHLALFGGPEVRAYLAPIGKMRLGFAVFLDAGRVWENEGFFSMSDLMFSAGLGPRLRTAFGSFRLDVAFRLNKDDAFENDPAVLLHFGFSEAF